MLFGKSRMLLFDQHLGCATQLKTPQKDDESTYFER